MPKGVHNGQLRGSSHPRWNRCKLLSSSGYVKVRVGLGHPLADSNGYAYEHLIVWMSSGNPRPKLNELIHHINGDKHDNRLCNLKLEARSEHNREHNMRKSRNRKGQFISAGHLMDDKEYLEVPQ